MKPINKEQITETVGKVISNLKALWSRRPRKPEKVKPVKKNTWRRNLRALDLQLDRRQQQRALIPVEIDDTERTCSNCSTVYHGRVCPQCGQVGVWMRFTWRQAILNFLDIWGLGNRPMFRTLRDLFWRPGYMARDYLNGQRQYYFPPFKLLAVVVVFTILVSMLPGVTIESRLSDLAKLTIDDFQKYHPNAFFTSVINAFIWFAGFLSQNMLYEWLFIGVIMVICIKIGFHGVKKYNMVETYIFLMFILSQMLICKIPIYLGNSLTQYIQTHALIGANGAMSPWAMGFLSVSGLISTVYSLFICYLLLLDFRQFYGLKWKSVIWRIFLSYLVVVVVALIVLYFGAIFANYDDQNMRNNLFIAGLISLVIVAAFVYAAQYLKQNKTLVNKRVTRISKTAMLSVFLGIGVGVGMRIDGYNFPSCIAVTILYVILATAFSLLPVVIYKKYNRTWLVLLSLIPIIVLVGCVMLYVNQ